MQKIILVTVADAKLHELRCGMRLSHQVIVHSLILIQLTSFYCALLDTNNTKLTYITVTDFESIRQ